MSQMSLFAADQQPPVVPDLVGLLAGPGQSTLSSEGARLSVVVDEHWRADALVELLREAGAGASVTPLESTAEGVRGLSVSTGTSSDLEALVRPWRRGAAAIVPAGWVPGAGELRVWALAAGSRTDDGAYALEVDAAVDVQAARRDALLAGLAGAGVAATYVGPRGGGPLLRVTSARRLRRLRETLGERPPGVPGPAWP